MGEVVQPRAYGPSPVRFVVETAIYFAAISLPFLLLDIGTALLVVVGGLAAAIVCLFALLLWKGPRPDKGSLLNHVLAGIYSLAGGMAGLLAIMVTSALWMKFGYDFAKTDGDGVFDFGVNTSRAAVAAIGVVAALALLVYVLPLASLRRRGVISGSFMSFVQADLAGFFRSPMVRGAAVVLAVAGLIASLATLLGLEQMVDSLFPDTDTDVTDVGALFPVLPMGLLATCMLMAIARPEIQCKTGLVDEIRAHFKPGSPDKSRRPAWQGMVTAVASAGVIFAVVYPIHFGMVAALSVVNGILPWSTISTGIDDWITVEKKKGRGDDELAADLNRYGAWSANSPGDGLEALIPGLEEGLSGAADSRCRAEISAAPVDPASLAGVDRGDLENYWPENGVSYCLRLACPSPAAWDAAPPVIFHSSHPSRNYMWVYNIYMDVFAYGAAPEPGGFCTADGNLADSYQG